MNEMSQNIGLVSNLKKKSLNCGTERHLSLNIEFPTIDWANSSR